MKKALLFIVLKVVEIAALVVAYFLLCELGYYIAVTLDLLADKDSFLEFRNYSFMYFIVGLLPLLVIVAAILIFKELVPDWIALNKKWVDKILK